MLEIFHCFTPPTSLFLVEVAQGVYVPMIYCRGSFSILGIVSVKIQTQYYSITLYMRLFREVLHFYQTVLSLGDGEGTKERYFLAVL